MRIVSIINLILLVILFAAMVFFLIELFMPKLKISEPKIEPFKSNQRNIPKEPQGFADISDPYKRPITIPNFIKPEQCDQIIEYSNGKLFDSLTVSGRMNDIRNSKQLWISKNNPLARSMFMKVSKMFNVPFENAEDLQVVRYEPGEYYKEHHDSCCNQTRSCRNFMKNGGQRILTVLVYLNDPNEYEGGHTSFPRLDQKVKLPKGHALAFYPTAQNDLSKCHPLALHAGTDVKAGTKWICNMWFREERFPSNIKN